MKTKLQKVKVKILFLFFRYSFFVFPFLWLLTLIFSILESFTYSGFLFKHLFLGFQLFLVLTIILGFLVRFGIPVNNPVKKKWVDYYKILSLVNNLFFPIIFVITWIASSVEEAHFKNYVFSTIHIQPKNLYWVCFVSLYLVILELGSIGKTWFLDKLFLGTKVSSDLLILLTEKEILALQKGEELTRLIVKYFKRIIICSLFFWVIGFNLRYTSSEIFKNLSIIIKHPFASYDEKMKMVWGGVYEYMLFIKKNTPPDALIANPPPEPPWNNEGSEPLVNAFLFPRKTTQHFRDINYIDLKADYAMLAWGWWRCTTRDVGPDDEWCHGWPRVEVPAEWIIYRRDGSTEIEEKLDNVNFIPTDDINKYKWGLIKIQKSK